MSDLLGLIRKSALAATPTLEDPYESVGFLGTGGFGSVDAVIRRSATNASTRQLFARKRFKRPIVPPAQRQKVMQELAHEAEVLRSMCFHHVVELVEYYHCHNHFCLVISPVADGTLTEILTCIDFEEFGPSRDSYTEIMKRWPYCLLQVMAYLHSMRIKHRDIKPSNVLIYQDTVLLADFGIAKIMPDDEASGTDGSVGAHTYIYAAPEVIGNTDAHRGRAADIFSLGCVFLELSTALAGLVDARQTFADLRRDASGTLAYAENELIVLQWISYLWSHDYHSAHVGRMKTENQKSASTVAFHLSELAFLMLDPDSTQRITAEQLLQLTDSPIQAYYRLRTMSCEECRSCQLRNCGLEEPHSAFKTDTSRFARSPEGALSNLPADDWEVAKRKWLESHMHWRDEEELDIGIQIELDVVDFDEGDELEKHVDLKGK